jgi:hypothetical protein
MAKCIPYNAKSFLSVATPSGGPSAPKTRLRLFIRVPQRESPVVKPMAGADGKVIQLDDALPLITA